MVNGISDPCGLNRGLNKGRGSKFRVGSLGRQATPEDGWRTYRSKRCEYKKKDEDNNSKTLNDKNHQASFQKVRHRISIPVYTVTSNSRNLGILFLQKFSFTKPADDICPQHAKNSISFFLSRKKIRHRDSGVSHNVDKKSRSCCHLF